MFNKAYDTKQETHLKAKFDRCASSARNAKERNERWGSKEGPAYTHCPDPPENIPGSGTSELHSDGGI